MIVWRAKSADMRGESPWVNAIVTAVPCAGKNFPEKGINFQGARVALARCQVVADWLRLGPRDSVITALEINKESLAPTPANPMPLPRVLADEARLRYL